MRSISPVAGPSGVYQDNQERLHCHRAAFEGNLRLSPAVPAQSPNLHFTRIRSISPVTGPSGAIQDELGLSHDDRLTLEGILALPPTANPADNILNDPYPATFSPLMDEFSPSQFAYYSPFINGSPEIQARVDEVLGNMPEDTFDRAAARRVCEICPIRFYRNLSPILTVKL